MMMMNHTNNNQQDDQLDPEDDLHVELEDKDDCLINFH